MGDMPMKDIEYLYTFDVRTKDGWKREVLRATSMIEVSRELKIKLDDLRYVTKVKVR
jgi:hypothetical protein